MKKIFIISLIVILIVFFFVWYFFRSIQLGMSDNAIQHSMTIEESKKDKLFIGSYKSIEDSIILGDTKFKSPEIWCEKCWRTHHESFSKKVSKVAYKKRFNFIIPFDESAAKDKKIGVHNIDDINSSQADYVSGVGFVILYLSLDKRDTLTFVFGLDYGTGIADTMKYLKN